ncbi:MAG: tryptophan 7-halogenase, partial [Planctomycetaceae bacterium]
VLMRHSSLEPEPVPLRTRTRSIFTHVASLPQWHSIIESNLSGSAARHPFLCDHSALHHLLEEGWMWWLRFYDGLTSVGLVLDESACPFDKTVSAETEWNTVLGRYPSLQRAFSSAGQMHPQLIRTQRLQRLNRNVAGTDWALLPSAAGFIDPLHSTGLAHSLSGLERLVRILVQYPAGADRVAALQNYASTLVREFEWIDELVSGAGDCRGDFRKFTAFSMSYFAAATTYEQRRLQGSPVIGSEFLCADDDSLRRAVHTLSVNTAQETAVSFEALCERTLRPFNHVGLFSPDHPNMYKHTALPD